MNLGSQILYRTPVLEIWIFTWAIIAINLGTFFKELIFSLMNFLVLAVIAGIGAWWYFFKFRKDED